MDATFVSPWAARPARADSAEKDRPARPPRPAPPGPVLMGDCLVPAGGTTLLALLWRDWEDRAKGGTDGDDA